MNIANEGVILTGKHYTVYNAFKIFLSSALRFGCFSKLFGIFGNGKYGGDTNFQCVIISDCVFAAGKAAADWRNPGDGPGDFVFCKPDRLFSDFRNPVFCCFGAAGRAGVDEFLERNHAGDPGKSALGSGCSRYGLSAVALP